MAICVRQLAVTGEVKTPKFKPGMVVTVKDSHAPRLFLVSSSIITKAHKAVFGDIFDGYDNPVNTITLDGSADSSTWDESDLEYVCESYQLGKVK